MRSFCNQDEVPGVNKIALEGHQEDLVFQFGWQSRIVHREGSKLECTRCTGVSYDVAGNGLTKELEG